MIDFLEQCDISKNTIEKLYDKYPSQLFNLNCNEFDCIEIINYLKSIGINTVEEILLNNIEIFYETKEEIIKKFNEQDITALVEKINLEPTIINDLFK